MAAVGMSLGSMVANLTTGKKKYAEYQEEIEQIIEKAGKLTDELADYMQKMQLHLNHCQSIRTSKRYRRRENTQRRSP